MRPPILNALALSLLLPFFAPTAKANPCAPLLPGGSSSQATAPENLTLDEIIEAAKALKKAKIEISTVAMLEQNDTPKATKIISQSLGRPVQASTLIEAAVQHYKKGWGWVLIQIQKSTPKVAVTSTSEKSNKLRTRSPRYSDINREMILETLRQLDANNLPVNYHAMKTNKGGDKAEEVILKTTSLHARSSFVIGAALKLNPDWDQWLIDAGLNLGAARVNQTRLEKDFIIETVKILFENGFDVSHSGLVKGRDNESLTKLLFEKTGKQISSSKLVFDAVHPYNNPWPRNWNWWLEQAGIDPKKARPIEAPTIIQEALILQVIQELYSQGFKIHSAAMLKNEQNPMTKSLVEKITGQDLTTKDVLRSAVNFHERTWLWWIRKAGYNVLDNAIITPPTPAEKIVELIRELHDQGHLVNWAAMADKNNSAKLQSLVVRVLGKKRALSTILTDAVYRHKKAWETWLIEAGLDPNEIRLRGSAPYHLLNAVLRDELVSNYNAATQNAATRQYNRFEYRYENVVVDEVTPEIILRRKELTDTFASLYKVLNSQQSETLDFVLDYFSGVAEFNFSKIATYVSERTQRNVSEDEIIELFKTIRQNPSLKLLIEDLISS